VLDAEGGEEGRAHFVEVDDVFGVAVGMEEGVDDEGGHEVMGFLRASPAAAREGSSRGAAI